MPRRWARLRQKLSMSEARERLDEIGRACALGLAAYFTRISRTRHKTARRLGAEPTGILVFNQVYPPTSRTGAEIMAYRYGAKSVELSVSGIPFLNRAYGELHIVPKRAHALTIPISKEAYGKSAGELERDGWHLFTKKRGRGVRAESLGILFGKRTASGRAVPLFKLARSVTLPQDAKLLPSSEMIGAWAADALERSLAS